MAAATSGEASAAVRRFESNPRSTGRKFGMLSMSSWLSPPTVTQIGRTAKRFKKQAATRAGCGNDNDRPVEVGLRPLPFWGGVGGGVVART